MPQKANDDKIANMDRKRAIKLFVFDFDGTALGGHIPYEEFPKPFARFLDKLTASGIHWATNTTWGVEKQFAVIVHSRVKTSLAFLTGSTGREIATIKNGHLLLDEKYRRKMLARDRRFKKKNLPQIRRALRRMLDGNLVERIAYNSYGHHCLAFTCKKKNIKKVEECIKSLAASGEFYRWGLSRGSDTLIPKYMNKGEIIKVLQKRLGIKPENTIVAGDWTNDLHMFDPKHARWMVCPANADPRVKELVEKHGGVVAAKEFSWGVVEGVEKILRVP